MHLPRGARGIRKKGCLALIQNEDLSYLERFLVRFEGFRVVSFSSKGSGFVGSSVGWHFKS